MQADPDRPTYHFLPTEGLCHDPCGAIFWQGRYHLFFLHGSWAGSGPSYRSDGYEYKAWAHISSADLVHWEQHPNAIERGQTGELFLFDGTPTIIYPDPDRKGASCIATSHDGDLMHWRQHVGNPVLRNLEQESLEYAKYLVVNRPDVTAWQEGEWCYALTGAIDVENGGDTQYILRSRDLVAWEFMHQFYRSQRRWTGADEDCSCPQFFRLGSKWMLLCFSHPHPRRARYYLGRYENQRFYPEAHDRINWPGGNVHAPRTIRDGSGRRILFANLNEGRSQIACEAAGWKGAMSLPVVISLAADGQAIRYEPAPELQALRQDLVEVKEIGIGPDTERPLPEVRGDCMELALEFESQGPAAFGLKVRCAPDGSEGTTISLSFEQQTVQIDYRKASLRHDLVYSPDLPYGETQQGPRVQEAPFDFKQGERVKLRVFLDRSVLELFAGDRRYMAQRIFPSRPDSLDVRLFSRGGPTRVRRLRAWQMKAIHDER